MIPPKYTTIIATPLANCWFESHLVCVDNINCNRTEENTRLHFDILQSVIGDRRMSWLKRFPPCDDFSVPIRKLMADRLAMNCDALAILTEPGAMINIGRSYKKLKSLGVAVEVFSNEKEARKWLYFKR